MTACDGRHKHTYVVILCRFQHSRSNSKYEFAEQKENDYVPAGEIVIKNEAYGMAEKTAEDETSVHSVTLKFGDDADSEREEEEEAKDEKRMLQLDDEETHLWNWAWKEKKDSLIIIE